jgi:ubiquitin-like modifier-activating enzyme ATG7
MRHGAREVSVQSPKKLGCYYCNDIIAPADVCFSPPPPEIPADLPSLVTHRSHTGSDVHGDASWARANCVCNSCRAPRLAPPASLRVRPTLSERILYALAYGTTHASLLAPAPPPGRDAQQPQEGGGSVLGLVPHQLRGFLEEFRSVQIVGAAYDRCTGCSEMVRRAVDDSPIRPYG